MEDERALEQILQSTITILEQNKHEIQRRAHKARTAKDEILARLVQIKSEILKNITQTDLLERDYKLAQIHVMDIKRNAARFTEVEQQVAFKELLFIESQLGTLKEKQAKQLQEREQLEQKLREVNETVTKAEKGENQTALAVQLLSGGLQNFSDKVDELQMRQQLSLRIIKAQEDERLRVAREIHDGPAQSMANVVLRAEICEKLLAVSPQQVKEELHDLKEMVKSSLQEVRKIIFNLRPMVLDDLGIIPTLRRFITEWQKRTQASIELVVLGAEEQRLTNILEVAIFRIVQEALNNIAKHSQARRCVIKLEVLSSKVNITITDDGCGFDANNVLMTAEKESYGLIGIRERVELLEGQIKISSEPGKGTEIYVSIPIKR